MPDYLKWIKDKTAEFQGLHLRMDSDKDLAILETYTMMDEDNRERPDVENITFNDPMVFSNRVESNLLKANMQTVVSGEKLNDKDAAIIENFTKDYTTAIDESLEPREISSLMAFNIQQICHRGRIITRSTPSYDEDGFNPGILPMDARFTLYEYGSKYLKAVCYSRERTKYQIAAEYGDAIAEQMQGQTAVVSDLWYEDREIVYIGNAETKNVAHGKDQLPFVVQICPSGLTFMGDGSIAHNGESIFAANRNLYKPKNKLGSILMTLSIMSFMNGLQYESEKGTRAGKPNTPPYGKKFVVPIDKGTRGYFSMPVNDVQNATRLLYSMVEGALQQGSLPAVSYGSLQFPLSAVAISGLQEAEDPVYLPRLDGLARYYLKLYRLIIKQYIDMKLNVKLGSIGYPTEYKWSNLKKDYSMVFRFFATSPKQNMANISVAAALGGLVSDDFKRREVMQLENPDSEDSKIWAEKAPYMSPAIAKYKVIQGLIDRNQMIEANILAEELGLTLDQIKSGNLVDTQGSAPKSEPKQMMPMFAGRIGAGQRQAPGMESPASESTSEGNANAEI